jgi:hypothetical protein
MTYLAQRLDPLENVDSSMWIDEAIWGHMLYDEQTPWLIYLEFLNVLLDQHGKGAAFKEPNGFNRLKYWAAWRLELRNILFNSPRLFQIRTANTNDQARWREWHKSMSRSGGLDQPDFTYLERRFHSFDDFSDLVEILRSTGIEATTNKRWTSKYAFPYGKDCVFEDLDQNARTNDRHFFRRTGELLYLMLCRSSGKDELLRLLIPSLTNDRAPWNQLVKLLQPEGGNPKGADRANAFLPYPAHPIYDSLAQDWISILKLGMPGYDALPHLVNLAAFNLIQYQLRVARDVAGITTPFKIVCELVAPKKTLVREVSWDLYQENNLFSMQAITAYIDAIERSEEWQFAKTQPGAFVRCRNILRDRVHWGDEYEGASNPDDLIGSLRFAAKQRHKQHGAEIHRNYGREVGLISKRGTVKLRYAPNDDLLKSLLLANVPLRMELHQFLATLWQRYALIFGDREAESVLQKDEFDKKAFQANARRLEHRLASLGLLKRLSDGCAYVINPYARKEP